MPKVKFHLVGISKFVVSILLLVTLVITTVNVISRARKRTKIPRSQDVVLKQKIEKKEKIEHFEVKGGEGNFQFSADRNYIGTDNHFHLEGNVELVFLKKAEGQDIFLYGDEIIYDKDLNNFFLQGKAKVKFKDLCINASSLFYNKKKEIIENDKNVEFFSDKMSGSAQEMKYFFRREKIELRKNINLKLKLDLNTPFPLILQGNKLDYERKRKQGVLEGDVRLFHGESRAVADELKFSLFPSGEYIEKLDLKGNVRASLISEEKDNSSYQKQAPLVLYNEKREIRADEIIIIWFKDLQKIHKIGARGNCSFKFFSSSGSFTWIQAEALEFVVSKNGKLRRFDSFGNASITEQKEEEESRRVIKGYSIFVKEGENVLIAKGKDKLKARILYEDYEISAGDIKINLDNNDLDASKDVKVILNQQMKEKKPSSLFSKDTPVFIISKEMRYFDAEKRFYFTGDIKAWQENRKFISSELSLFRETGKLFCAGKVESVFPYRPKDRNEVESLKISAEKMDYNPDKNLIVYRDKNSLRVKDIDLQAKSLFVYLNREDGELKEITGRGAVVITQNQNEGRGEEVRYDANREMMILTGKPVFMDRNRGRTEGDKLTFYIADGKIAVENKDRERSVTVIK